MPETARPRGCGRSALPYVHFIQRAQHLPEVADAWEDNLRRTFEPPHRGLIRTQRRSHPACFEQNADYCSVIENRDHNKPLVDGS